MLGRISAILGAVLLTAACALAPGRPAPAATPSPPARAIANQEYRLGEGDKLRITVFSEPQLSGEFVVGSTGTIALPLIGEVPATALTAKELTTAITARLAAGYLRDPKVSVEVSSFRPYYILGEVMQPGEYAYSNGLTVLNAVAIAKGFTYRADKRRVFIKRAGAATEAPAALQPGLAVQPGDTIRVQERFF